MACEFSLDKLASSLTGGARVRMWTFTMPGLYKPKETAKAWVSLRKELQRVLGFWGIRVYELHPGGHGLHVHLVTSGWFNVNAVRVIVERLGWGRVNVRLMNGGISYVAKYLHKASRSGVLKGLRLWDIVGQKLAPFIRTRIKDVESDTTVGRAYRSLFDKFFHESLGLEGIPLREWCFSLCRSARRMILVPEHERYAVA
jgi:hypothetical protein